MIQINNLVKKYGDVNAVNDISLTIEKGEVFGFLGTNGAGKTTTMNMLCGQFAPTSGNILIDGHTPTSTTAKRKIGIAPQTLAFYPTLSVDDNLLFFARMYGLDKEHVDKALESVRLTEKRSAIASTLSGGMQRRLNLAIATLHNPDILLLDEATVGVDAQSRIEILEIVQSLKDSGHTIIYTTHYLEEAEKLCDRIAIIHAGKIHDVGSLQELKDHHGSPSTIYWTENEKRYNQLLTNEADDIKTILEKYPNAHSFDITHTNLEDVFISLTEK